MCTSEGLSSLVFDGCGKVLKEEAQLEFAAVVWNMRRMNAAGPLKVIQETCQIQSLMFCELKLIVSAFNNRLIMLLF